MTEKRLYQTWVENPKTTPGQVNMKTGILLAKKALNKLHHVLGNTSYNQVGFMLADGLYPACGDSKGLRILVTLHVCGAPEHLS